MIKETLRPSVDSGYPQFHRKVVIHTTAKHKAQNKILNYFFASLHSSHHHSGSCQRFIYMYQKSSQFQRWYESIQWSKAQHRHIFWRFENPALQRRRIGTSKEASTSLSRALCNAKFSSLNSSQASSWACKSVSIVGSSVSIPIARQVARPWLSGPVWHLHKDAGAETQVQGLCLLHLDSCVHSLRSAHIASARTMIPCTTFSGKLAGGSNRWGVAIFSRNCHQDICFKVESLL